MDLLEDYSILYTTLGAPLYRDRDEPFTTIGFSPYTTYPSTTLTLNHLTYREKKKIISDCYIDNILNGHLGP